LPDTNRFATPLGEVTVEPEGAGASLRLPQVRVQPEAHVQEHSLEVELPFLQALLGDFVLVPLAVGEADAEEVAEVLERLWGGPETLIVVSSDLSHYLPYEAARQVDRETADEILSLGGPIDPRRACGARPISGLLLAARRRGMVPELLDLRNSGDTAGDRDRVVGYGAFAFREVAA
jgi:AmmeMemoRadiSam system protein B